MFNNLPKLHTLRVEPPKYPTPKMQDVKTPQPEPSPTEDEDWLRERFGHAEPDRVKLSFSNVTKGK